MRHAPQQTLQRPATLSGIGLHSGKDINMVIKPAQPDHGIIFVRSDFPKEQSVIPARWDHVSDTQLCTVIANQHGASVGTIEHLMSALRGCGIDNALIEIDGIEVPAMDGSAMPFVTMIENVGIKQLSAPRRMIRVLKEVSVIDNDKRVVLKPGESSIFEGEIDFDHDEIGNQKFTTQLVNGNFKHDIASARTFGFFHEAQWLRSQGLGLGGSLDNAIILDESAVMNPDGLRFNDEFIRHKLLDAIGDLYLAGGQILGRYDGIKAGHAINNAILHALFADSENWEYTTSAGSDIAHLYKACA
ncbi:MAG: UDP-3-O-acyl-N-acetylglucosamine deacetylase [Alphaproteobacteria bacterium]